MVALVVRERQMYIPDVVIVQWLLFSFVQYAAHISSFLDGLCASSEKTDALPLPAPIHTPLFSLLVCFGCFGCWVLWCCCSGIEALMFGLKMLAWFGGKMALEWIQKLQKNVGWKLQKHKLHNRACFCMKSFLEFSTLTPQVPFVSLWPNQLNNFLNLVLDNFNSTTSLLVCFN